MRARMFVFLLLAMVAALGAYACVPRQADLRAFNPSEMGRLESAMWRDYYEKHYARLFYHLYQSSRAQFGFSPLDSVRIGFSAAQAARAFQPTRSRQQAEAAALPDLVTYYGLLRPAAPVAFDVRDVAHHEIDWWQARRESVGPELYGRTVAKVAALTYGLREDSADVLAFGISRAEAMAYRDARGEAITDRDWSTIEAQLQTAYQHLKAELARGN